MTLHDAWKQTLKLCAEGSKLKAEGDKLYAEGNNLYAEGNKLQTEGDKRNRACRDERVGYDAEHGCTSSLE